MNCPFCKASNTTFEPETNEWWCKSCYSIWPDSGTTDLTLYGIKTAYDTLSLIPRQKNSLDINSMISVAQYMLRKAYFEATGANL